MLAAPCGVRAHAIRKLEQLPRPSSSGELFLTGFVCGLGGHFDLATYQNNKFYFNLSSFGAIDGNVDTVINFGAFPKTARPVAADMDGDGFTDVGLFVPARSTQTGALTAEWNEAVTRAPRDR